MSIDDIALQTAREWLMEKSKSTFALLNANENQIKESIELLYVGGWDAFRQQVFNEIVA